MDCQSCHGRFPTVMFVGKFMSNIHHELKSHCTSSYLSRVRTASSLSLVDYSYWHMDWQSCHDHVLAVMFVGKFMSNFNHKLKSHCTSSYLSSVRIVSWVSLNTPDEHCMCQVRMPCSVGAIFLILPILSPWRLFLGFSYKFGFYGPKLP